jgi:hypothetical protein
MAQAAEQHTPSSIEWSLDDYVAQLIVTLGCEKYPALWGMWDRIANRRLLFFRLRLVDGKPYSPWDHETIHGTPKPFNKELVDADYFRSDYRFEFDDHDRVRVQFARVVCLSLHCSRTTPATCISNCARSTAGGQGPSRASVAANSAG